MVESRNNIIVCIMLFLLGQLLASYTESRNNISYYSFLLEQLCCCSFDWWYRDYSLDHTRVRSGIGRGYVSTGKPCHVDACIGSIPFMQATLLMGLSVIGHIIRQLAILYVTVIFTQMLVQLANLHLFMYLFSLQLYTSKTGCINREFQNRLTGYNAHAVCLFYHGPALQADTFSNSTGASTRFVQSVQHPIASQLRAPLS